MYCVEPTTFYLDLFFIFTDLAAFADKKSKSNI